MLKQDTHLVVEIDVLCACAGCEIKLYFSTWSNLLMNKALHCKNHSLERVNLHVNIFCITRHLYATCIFIAWNKAFKNCTTLIQCLKYVINNITIVTTENSTNQHVSTYIFWSLAKYIYFLFWGTYWQFRVSRFLLGSS